MGSLSQCRRRKRSKGEHRSSNSKVTVSAPARVPAPEEEKAQEKTGLVVKDYEELGVVEKEEEIKGAPENFEGLVLEDRRDWSLVWDDWPAEGEKESASWTDLKESQPLVVGSTQSTGEEAAPADGCWGRFEEDEKMLGWMWYPYTDEELVMNLEDNEALWEYELWNLKDNEKFWHP